jgi:hypothetical protein
VPAAYARSRKFFGSFFQKRILASKLSCAGDLIVRPSGKTSVIENKEDQDMDVDAITQASPPPDQDAVTAHAWQCALQDAGAAPLQSAAAAPSTTQATRPDQQRLAVAEQLVHTGGTASSADKDAVAKHLASTMSLDQLKHMQQSGLHITVARGSVTDDLTNLKGVHPRGYPPGASWDTVPGTVDPADSHNIIVATHTGPNGERELPGPAQSASADVTLHEAGHAINRLSGANRMASEQPDFMAAYAADANHGPLADGYYHQVNAPAGRDEAYAESHAEFMHDPARMKTEYPHLYAYWQNQYGAKP